MSSISPLTELFDPVAEVDLVVQVCQLVGVGVFRLQGPAGEVIPILTHRLTHLFVVFLDGRAESLAVHFQALLLGCGSAIARLIFWSSSRSCS